MKWERAPQHIVTAVEDGLIDAETWLLASVAVKVPLRRRDRRLGWPAAIFSAVIIGSELGDGILAAWAVSSVGHPIASITGAACEFSYWPLPGIGFLNTTLEVEILSSYPEFIAAQQGTMSVASGAVPPS